MRSVLSVLFAFTILSSAPSAAVGQQSVDLESGVRARLVSATLPPEQQVVRIVSTTRDTVVFRSERYPVTRSLAVSEISAVDVSLGQRRQTARGAGIGLLSGVVIGAVAGYATFEPCEGWCLFGPSTRSGSVALSATAGGLLGLVAGTTIGFLRKTEKWKRVRTNTTIGVSPYRRGGAVAVSRAF